MRYLILGGLMLLGGTGQVVNPCNTNPPSSGITLAIASCRANIASKTVSCTPSSAWVAGDLIIAHSKTEGAAGSATATATSSSCTFTQTIAPISQTNGSGQFWSSESACIVTSAAANSVTMTWGAASPTGTFSDIEVISVHTTSTWKASFLDKAASSVQTVASTSCPTGTTAVTTNSNDFIYATCNVFNLSQTWGDVSGFTAIPGINSTTSGNYYKTVGATGAQSATITLFASDVGVGTIAAYASN